MKKVTRINTIQDCIQKLHYIYYNFYFTDLLMHKQAVVYEIESYQKKMIKRLKIFFYKLKKVMEKTDKEEMIRILQEKEDAFLQHQRKEKTQKIKYSPERITIVEICVTEERTFRAIRAMLAEEPFAEKTLQDISKLKYELLPKWHREFREELRDYGYVPRKEKIVEYLKR